MSNNRPSFFKNISFSIYFADSAFRTPSCIILYIRKHLNVSETNKFTLFLFENKQQRNEKIVIETRNFCLSLCHYNKITCTKYDFGKVQIHKIITSRCVFMLRSFNVCTLTKYSPFQMHIRWILYTCFVKILPNEMLSELAYIYPFISKIFFNLYKKRIRKRLLAIMTIKVLSSTTWENVKYIASLTV